MLGVVVANHAYQFSGLTEGDLSRVRAAVVNRTALAEVASEVGLGEHLRLGKGESVRGERGRLSILSDAMEALIGAVFLDQGWPAAQELVLRLFGARVDRAAEDPGGLDFKTQLQELTHRAFQQDPDYQISSDGLEHEPRFVAVVRVAGRVEGEGEGRSKKLAEQQAARVAWLRLSERVADESDLKPDTGREPDLDEAGADQAGGAPSDHVTFTPVTPSGPNPAQPDPVVTGGSRESEMHDA